MNAGLPAPHPASPSLVDWRLLGYPFRAMVMLAAGLLLFVLFAVLPVSTAVMWTVAVVVMLATCTAVALRTHQVAQARLQSSLALAALGSTTAELPVSLRTRMPLVMVTGDALPNLFNRGGIEERLVHIGDGAIWLRVSRPQALPQLAVAIRQWRDGRAPDGVVLSLAPALHASEDEMAQMLRVTRQSVADAARMLGVKVPGYLAVYQRLTATDVTPDAPQWHGVSSRSPIANVVHFEALTRAAEVDVLRANDSPKRVAPAAARAAALASIIDWTQRAVIGPLSDRLQPTAPWALFGVGWIDCGPLSAPGMPWPREVALRTRIVPPVMPASASPWPLPQPLIDAMPQRAWVSPRKVAAAQVFALFACAAALAIWGSAKNNQALITRICTDLHRFYAIAPNHDTARQDALQTLISDRNQLERYGRTGVPLRLSFGMYRGAPLMTALDTGIASYQPLPAPPAVISLDSMSLFASGQAQLKPGSTRAMVGVLELIKAHPDKLLLVAGHTDNVGDADSNLRLAAARAAAVRDWLIEASGMSATRFAIQGYGDTRPIADNGTDAGRARNRRVEITLVPDASDSQAVSR